VALVTGGDSGIGAATVELLTKLGARVIAADIRDAELIADLGNGEGRARLLRQAAALAPEGLDLVVTCAGLSRTDPEPIVSVNYFGAVETLHGLRGLLARRGPASAIAVASVAALAEVDERLVATCLAGDEAGARALAADIAPPIVYNSTKRAVSLWVRRTAPTSEWAGSKVFLNAVAPGFVRTPMTERFVTDEAVMAQIRKMTPIAVSDVAEPSALAEAIVSLGTLRGGYLLGQVLFVDGGSDAILRPDAF
jgi:NAD(P)-dependent dehydrogenase (short-subunit alcohol dehydrogenase family)